MKLDKKYELMLQIADNLQKQKQNKKTDEDFPQKSLISSEIDEILCANTAILHTNEFLEVLRFYKAVKKMQIKKTYASSAALISLRAGTISRRRCDNKCQRMPFEGR